MKQNAIYLYIYLLLYTHYIRCGEDLDRPYVHTESSVLLDLLKRECSKERERSLERVQ